MGWTYEFDNDVGPDDDYYIEFFSVYDGLHEKIGQFDDEENARVASAAPDLFDSIIDLVEVVTTAINAGDWKVDGACDPDAVLERSLRAIAKASGETWTTTN